ncbi:hypothetical protein KO491_08575 [Roseovarius nubinhibens]|nr:hypothetical protein [Roseovarius nubinhibens]MBU2999892.1 hypothetical protein [Roseovarius nubinhibens]
MSQLARSPDRAIFCTAGQITVALADITADHCHVADPPEIAQNQTMPIRVASSLDIETWAKLRAQLWSAVTYEQHLDEIAEMLTKPPG